MVNNITIALCESVDKIPDGGGWIFEPKLDGVRALSIGGIIYNRKNGSNAINRSISPQFPEIQPIPNCVLDGEIVGSNVYEVIGRSNTDDRFKIRLLSKTNPAKFVVFDILFLNGQDLRGLPFTERRKMLEEVGKKLSTYLPKDLPTILPTDVYTDLPTKLGQNVELIRQYGDGQALWDEISNNGGEGIVAKRRDSIYVGRRTPDWVKVKRFQEKILPILRWEMTPEGGFVIFVPLDNGQEQKVVVNSIDFQNRIVKNPNLKAEIQFLELSKNGRLRHPSIKSLI